MKAVELLEKYPETAKVISEFYNNKLIDSMNDSSEEVSEEFKEMLKQQSFDNEYVASFIDSNPRFLFDVFDANEIIIHTPSVWINNVVEFGYTVERKNNVDTVGFFETYPHRNIAEKHAVEKAFEILNEKLCQIK